jgi:ribosomal RNA-processing protein 12
VLLCLKDSNGKAREAAYQLLVSMAAVHENKTEIFRVIMAALGAQTPHMRSAAVLALSRLVFEYARTDDSVYGLLQSLLQTVIMLFNEDSREVTKSVVGFVRVSVAAMTQEQFEPLLPEIVGGLLKFHKAKDRFRSKIKIILKKLVRVYGYDRLMPLVPEADTRLLTHMRKLSKRAARQKAAQQQGPGSNHFDNLMESDEEDSDDGRTLMTGATGLTKMTGRTGKSVRSAAMDKSVGERSVVASTAMTTRTRHAAPRLRAEANGNVMDMLDPKMANCVHFADDVSYDSDSDAGVMEFDEMGRLVVPDDSEVAFGEGGKGVANNEDNEDEIAVPSKRQRVSKFESAKAVRDQAHKQKSKKKQVQPLGAAYKSKKAGGDVKKKGQKYEPYAYVPLDGKSYTKKNRRDTVEQMSTVVRGGKRKRRN